MARPWAAAVELSTHRLDPGFHVFAVRIIQPDYIDADRLEALQDLDDFGFVFGQVANHCNQIATDVYLNEFAARSGFEFAEIDEAGRQICSLHSGENGSCGNRST